MSSTEDRRLTASVVICCYTQERWEQIVAAVDSVTPQLEARDELIVVVDHDEVLAARLRASRGHLATIVESDRVRGLSGARNCGVESAKGDIVAFLDDDAVASPGWLTALRSHYSDPDVLGVGGEVVPLWPDRRPSFLPAEFDWVVGCSYVGMDTGTMRNMIGANMSMRRALFDDVGGFHEGLGRMGNRPLGCEETEFCIRARRRLPAGRFVFASEAEVHHHVSTDRTSPRYFIRRCFSEGRSKAIVSALRGSQEGLSSERHHATRVLPAAAARSLIEGVRRRDVAALTRGAMVAAGLGVTTAGYLMGRFGGLLGGAAGSADEVPTMGRTRS